MNIRIKTFLRVLLCALLLAAGGQSAFAEAGRTVTVACIDYNGFITKEPDGSYSGYAADYLAVIAQYTGWNYRFVDMDWPTAFRAVREGKIDFYFVARQREERLPYFDFSRYPICNEAMNIYTLPDREVYYEDFKAFDGMRVGMLEDSGEIDYFNKYAHEHGFSYVLSEYPMNKAAEEALRKGEVDAIAIVNYSVNGNFKLIGNFGVAPAYLMSREGSPLMAEFSKAQERLYFDDPDFALNLEKKYYGDMRRSSSLLLTRAEAEYIGSADVLNVAIGTDMAPLEYYDENTGLFHGVTVDLYNMISDVTGLKFNFIKRTDVESLLADVKKGQVHLTGATAQNGDTARILGIRQTRPYSENSFSVVTRAGERLTASSVMAVPANYPIVAIAARRKGFRNIRRYGSSEECVEAVYRGEADLTYVTSMSESYLLDHVQYSDLRASVLPDTSYMLCLGVFDTPGNGPLFSVIDKAVATIRPREIAELIISNTAAARPPENVRDYLARHGAALLFLLALFAAVVCFAVLRAQEARQQRLLNKKLTEHHNFLQHLYNTLPCGIFRYAYEKPHTVLSFNAACAKIYGYEDEPPFIGETSALIVKDGTEKDFMEIFDRCEKSAAPIVYTWPITKKDGTDAYVECVMEVVETEQGKVFQEVFIDETERVLREKQIEEQYARELNRGGSREEGFLFTLCVDVTRQTLARCDGDVEGAREGMGVDEFFSVITPELGVFQSEEWINGFRAAFSEAEASEAYKNERYENSFTACRRKDGHIQWLRFDLALRLHPAGDLLCFVYVWDITDEHVKNDIVRRMALAGCDSFMSVDTATGVCLQYTDSGAGGFLKSKASYGKTDIISRMAERMTESDAEELRSATELPVVGERLAADGRYQVYAVLADENGERQDKALTYFCTDRENGVFAVTIADVTEVRRSEVRHAALLSDALKAAEKADAAKSQFLSRVSHEIRTPLNAIIGFMELAKDADAKTVENYLASSEIAAKQLLSLINDVLDMSSIESGKMKIAHAPFDFRRMISSVTNIFGMQCRQKGVSFETKITTHIDDWLVGDELRVNQILINLLGNAVKFTAKGHIWLKISQTEAEGDKAFVRFEVSDTGCGMSEEMKERLFRPFEQESAATAREHGGSGLGLSIVKNLSSLMDGCVRVESVQGEGSTFIVELPFSKSDINAATEESGAKQEQGPQAWDFAGKRALLAEDNNLNQIVATGYLTRRGVAVDVAGDGREAVDKFLASEPGYYDAILMDIQMPLLDGYGAAKAVRSSGRPDAKTVPIIAQTANAFDEDMAKAFSAGMNAHLAKPIDPDALYRTLARCGWARAEGNTPAGLNDKDNEEHKRINENAGDVIMTREKLIEAGIDYDKGLARFAGKAHLYEKYLLKFFNSGLLAELQNQIEAEDYDTAFKTAHDLKGTSGNLSVDALFEKISELVEYLREGGRGETALKLCREAVALYGEAEKAIKE